MTYSQAYSVRYRLWHPMHVEYLKAMPVHATVQ
jgi:hypothetical protein